MLSWLATLRRRKRDQALAFYRAALRSSYDQCLGVYKKARGVVSANCMQQCKATEYRIFVTALQKAATYCPILFNSD